MSAFPLPRAAIRVGGAEAEAFLDALTTNAMHGIAPGAARYAALLTPQGKLVADFFVIRDPEGDGLVLDVAASLADDLLRRLTLYKLRAAVTIEAAPYGVVAGAADDALASYADPRLPAAPPRALTLQRRIAEAEPPHYLALRVALGLPDPAIDAGAEEVFALEALLDELGGVDFKKGCFVGQENVSRMKRRATTRKKFCPLAFDGPAPPYGAAVLAGDVEIGGVRSRDGSRALALLRLDRAFEALEAGASLSAGGMSARLDPPPWLLLPSAEARAE